MSSKETIAAIATPSGQGSIGVIRVSGDRCHDIYQSIIGGVPCSRRADYVRFKTAKQQVIDRGVAIYFKSPASYTGEDVLECHLHGNQIVLARLLEEIVSLGARLALPGEFTERAFLNDKMDLVQAEAVAALIESRSRSAARSAIQSLEGVFSDQVLNLRTIIFEAVSFIEATLDFPEEEGVRADLDRLVQNLIAAHKTLDRLLNKANAGRVLAQSPSVVIVGPTNVGKSSIINFLSGSDVAIVSQTPGTTRDPIKQEVLLADRMFTLVDTAGIRDAKDAIEQEGIKRTYKAIEQADLVLYVCDVRLGQDQGFSALKANLAVEVTLLRLWNKIDLYSDQRFVNSTHDFYISAKTGLGMDVLVDQINKNLVATNNEEDVIFARQRHIDQLHLVQKALAQALHNIENNIGLEVVAENLRQALLGFDTLTGRTTTDDILGEVFSRFCIGK